MGKFFIRIYNYFQGHKTLLYASLVLWVAVMAFFASKIKFEENITRIFPDTENSKNMMQVFNNLRVKDKIVVMLSATDDSKPFNPSLPASARELNEKVEARLGGTHINNILFKTDSQLQQGMTNMVYAQLPFLLTDADYARIDSLLTEERIAQAMRNNYTTLLSPTAVVMKDFIMKDPLGIGWNTLQTLQDFQLEASYKLHDGYIFSQDGRTLLMFITPAFDMGETAENDKLVSGMEEAIAEVESSYPEVDIEYFGGAAVSVYNARQIKQDTMITLSIALAIIIIFIYLVFKQKRSIPLIITPVAFGGLFALFLIYFIKGSISAIAVGAGSAVLGIALSYSIHIVAHQNHVSDIRELIAELANPLTIGSFTTICAFLGLLFTSSELLQDFGLFAALTLIGTTIFCLVYLPHFLRPAKEEKESKLLSLIERFNAYSFEKNKWLAGGIVLLIAVCLFTSKKVGFESDMNSLNFEPPQLKQSEQKLNELFKDTKTATYIVSTGENLEETVQVYHETNRRLAQMRKDGLVSASASADRFIASEKEQDERLNRWNAFWTSDKKAFVQACIEKEATALHLKPTAFQPFFDWLNSDFSPTVSHSEALKESYLNEFISEMDGFCMLISQVQFDESNKEAVYEAFLDDREVVIFDRSYFVGEWVASVNDDFYLVLYISSFLIFFALLVSFGRIELTLISFLPMFLSWIIIIGIMGIFGVQFNIVNIILSTFIFGIGDDFSIFIMDGLQNKYKTGKRIINSHKTAIFFSAFTIIVGMGSLVFARHPALQSISWMSILGMIVVVLISFTIQPIIFKWFISRPASKKQPPYTLINMMGTFFDYLLFVTGSVAIRLFILLLYPVPIPRRKKKQAVSFLLTATCKMLYWVSYPFIKLKKDIPSDLFDKPSIIIANHQSFLDIVTLLSLSTKVVMVTNKWVWKSPVFGSIIHYAGFIYAGEGYEENTELVAERLKEGYSVIIFPEGTRSADGTLNRFHKGAFYIAQQLQVDITPIVLYGTGNTIPKKQPFFLKKGIVAVKALERIRPGDTRFGTTYREQAKQVRAYFRTEYEELCRTYDHAGNTYFYQRLVQNYMYKGPVVEGYVRVKVAMEHRYAFFDGLIPRRAEITDIGCGYGLLSNMLHLYSKERRLLGIDYDEEKIAVARHGFLANEHVRFVHADATQCELPPSDVFILNDVLHYMDTDKQTALLQRCTSLLRPEGLLIIRDGNKDEKQKQKWTRLTEVLSTRIFKFNKTSEPLSFLSEQQISDFAHKQGMRMESVKNDDITSNTIYILRSGEREACRGRISSTL